MSDAACLDEKLLAKGKMGINYEHRMEPVELFPNFFYMISDGAPSNFEDLYMRVAVEEYIQYHGFCKDFGPLNLAMVIRFRNYLVDVISSNPMKPLFVISPSDSPTATNVSFLLGAYMILELNKSPEDVSQHFQPFSEFLHTYRDVSPGKPNFKLYLRDCWQGLMQAGKQSLLDSGPDGFDLDEYEQLDNPLNADLHEVVRDKLLAMRGPRNLKNQQLWEDRPSGDRDFSPTHFVDILQQFDVKVVVRLNQPEYPAEEFETAGIAVVDLYFPDCSTPPPKIAIAFLMFVEALPGALAVHCKAGLGRTGTLIALYLMKHHAFTARAAIGWLRIVRPGSVIGDQQRYLCEMEETMRRASVEFKKLGGPGIALAGTGVAGVKELFGRVMRATDTIFHRAEERQRHRLQAANQRASLGGIIASTGKIDDLARNHVSSFLSCQKESALVSSNVEALLSPLSRITSCPSQFVAGGDGIDSAAFLARHVARAAASRGAARAAHAAGAHAI